MDYPQSTQKIVTRFAPSPTGLFHAGSYRTALFSCLYARQNGGNFILRIEDTDRERSKKEYEENIIESLEWMGLKYDEFYRQSDRTDIYRKQLQKLIDSGHAFISDETQRVVDPNATRTANAGPARTSVIRFRNPNKKVSWDDLIRGHIEFDTTELGDFVIAKSMDEPVFHLVVVVDDHEMGITHIIRGEDHISNTPRQLLIYEALGAQPPRYAHIPLLLAKDRSKMSKRHGAVPVSEYRDRGYLAAAVVNYLALLGWHPEGELELFSFDELVKSFSLERVQKSGAIFDEEKLKWFNRQYLLRLSDEQFAAHSKSFLPEWLTAEGPLFKRLLPVLKDKISAFGEIAGLFDDDGELHFVKEITDYKSEMLLWKKNPDKAVTAAHLKECRALIEKMPTDQVAADSAASKSMSGEPFTMEAVKAAIWPYAEAKGKGDVLWPLRVALTGQEKSPDPFVSASLLGREECLKRIDVAIAKLS